MQPTRSFIEILADELRKEIRAEVEAEYGQLSAHSSQATVNSRFSDSNEAVAKAEQIQLWLSLRMGGALTGKPSVGQSVNPYAASGSSKQKQNQKPASPRQLTSSAQVKGTATPSGKIGRVKTIEQTIAVEFFNREGSSLGFEFTEAELKSEFRKIAMKIHPDRHAKVSRAELEDYSSRFQTLVESAEILEAALI